MQEYKGYRNELKEVRENLQELAKVVSYFTRREQYLVKKLLGEPITRK
jgi:hypothetical protein